MSKRSSKRRKVAPPPQPLPSYAHGRARNKDLLDRANKAGAAGEHDTAEKLWREYLKDTPDDPDVNFNVGVCIGRRADSPADRVEAAEHYERVVQSAGASMERKADAMNNLGLIAEKTGHTDKAAIAYGFALKMWPEHGAARVNLGDAKRFLGDWKGAAQEYDAVLDQDPQSAEAHFCAGMIALLLGDWERGWREYRWRYRTASFKSKPFISDKPPWTGEALDGKTLLMVAEQGWGDQVMMARYPAELKRRWPMCRVIYHCDPCMHRLFDGIIGLDAVAFNPVDGFDCVCHVMDLPGYCGMKSEADIPYAYCIRPMPDWPVWKLENVSLLPKRVGLVWAGSPTHGKDKARSIAATMYQPLIDAHPECDFYALQAGPAQPQVAELRNVTDLAPQITNWTDTAQMLACMDVLVSVDTACVHLAGAMGTPCHVLIPFSPDFRWQLAREDSPWYAKARLFRQPSSDDWQTPIQRINEAI